MRKFSIFAALAVMAATSSVFAVTIRDDRADTSYRNLGASYGSVGQFVGSGVENGSTINYSASGVLIAPEWVLTAGHVADSTTTSLTFKINGTNVSASAWYANSNWTGNLGTGYDISLVKLSTTISGPVATLYSGTGEIGKVGTYVGYGMTGTGSTGYTVFDQQKRGAQNMVDAFLSGSGSRILMSDFDNINKKHQKRDNAMGGASPLDLEGLIAPGDSGGGMFITENGRTYLAGINSWGSSRDGNTNSDYGDYSGVTRVSSHIGWINGILDGYASSAANGTFYAGSGGNFTALRVPIIPEPATLGVLGLGGLVLLARRRR